MPRKDPWARARKATEEMERHLAAIGRLADKRAIAIQELLDRGLTRAEVARGLGVTPAVITKLLKRPAVGGTTGEGEHVGIRTRQVMTGTDGTRRSGAGSRRGQVR